MNSNLSITITDGKKNLGHEYYIAGSSSNIILTLFLHLQHTVAATWAVSGGGCLALTLALYGTFHGATFSMVENILYGTLSNLAWALAVAPMVYLCWHGYGGTCMSLYKYE